MSSWTYVKGIIDVWPMGRTQPEKRYILDTILEHLPDVTGSEHDMHVKVIQKDGYNGFCTHNEFGEWIPGKIHETQDFYQVIIDGSFRHREFDETLREFNKWLNRLAKRVYVEDILVKISGINKMWIISDPKPYQEMEELPSWSTASKDRTISWAEYLMWEPAKDSQYPMMLMHKYYDDPENDAEVERRIRYERGTED